MRKKGPKRVRASHKSAAEAPRVPLHNGSRFARASEAWDAGQLARAFRLFLIDAKAGDVSSQLNLGYFYDEGLGVRPNREKALYWYRRAYKGGSAAAALNIGLILRLEGATGPALTWFERALRLGDEDTALHIAEVYAEIGKLDRAALFLRRAMESTDVTEHTRDKARVELKQLARRR